MAETASESERAAAPEATADEELVSAVAWRLALAAVLSLFAVTFADVLAVPWEIVQAQPSLLPAVWAHTAGHSYLNLYGVLLYLLGVSVLEIIAAWMGRSRPASSVRLRWGGHLTLAAAFTGYAYATLTRYDAFHGVVAIMAAFVVLFLLFGASGIALGARPRSGWARRGVWAVQGASAIGALGAQVVNRQLYPERYFTFHLALLLIGHALAFLALAQLLLRARRPRRPSPGPIATVALGFVVLFVVAPLSCLMGYGSRARAHVLLHTLVGQARVVFRPYTGAEEELSGSARVDPQGVERFALRSGLPPLPASLALGDYNILLVTSEALRFDKTSLSDESLDSTPHLLDLARSGASWYTRAHSPSSATLPSNAGLLSMTYPSATRLESWQKSWCGELLGEETTVAELLAGEGYATWRASHNFHEGFTTNLLGLGQGFASNHLVVERNDRDGLTLDQRIADHAIDHIAKAGAERFFGWVFFASPHAPYLARGNTKGRPAVERYLSEVHYVDEQLGRLLEALGAAGQDDRTIVIFTADHGEEFGEHGGSGHLTLHGECTHVPLVVRVPGVDGERVDAVTSTMYLFPWLLQHASGEAQKAAERRLTTEISPMISATDGGVITELIGHDKMATVLIYQDRKIQYDFISDSYEVYDLASDPVEQTDLLRGDPNGATDLKELVRKYREVRAGVRKFEILPDKKPVRRKRRRRSL